MGLLGRGEHGEPVVEGCEQTAGKEILEEIAHSTHARVVPIRGYFTSSHTCNPAATFIWSWRMGLESVGPFRVTGGARNGNGNTNYCTITAAKTMHKHIPIDAIDLKLTSRFATSLQDARHICVVLDILVNLEVTSRTRHMSSSQHAGLLCPGSLSLAVSASRGISRFCPSFRREQCLPV
jgi:hypothetical protein